MNHRNEAKTNARLTALQAMTAVLDQQQSLAECELFERMKDPRDSAFARRLSYGCLRWLGAVQWLTEQMLDKPLRRKDRDIQRLLYLGVYQLWQEDIPAHAAVHETTEIARKLRKKWAVGLINGVLRRFQREQASLLERMQQEPEQWAHPAWLLKALENDWPEHWQAIVQANNQQAPLWLRHNGLQGSFTEALNTLESAGMTTSTNPYAPSAVAVEPPRPVQEIPGFAQGTFSVQDAAAQLAGMLAAHHLPDKTDRRILDACAAPGGKTGHLLELVPEAEVLALDISSSRLSRVAENLQRLGLKADLRTADAAETSAWWDGRPFDLILLDAPCSATGVIRRHPDIKWLRQPDQVSRVCSTQHKLLRQLWPLLPTGGILVYATCSVLKCENSEQIQAFLDDHSDADCIGPVAEYGQEQSHGRQILPGEKGMDGFYYAVLSKSAH